MSIPDVFGGARRLWFATRKMRLPIASSALVLEVGSGDSPCPRSDVLLDLTLDNHERVGGNTVVDRPFVLGLIERLPFRDKAFDYVIAFHVLEHSAHPAEFLTELQRVAKAGYIETPSFWWERLTPLTMHHLEVGLETLDKQDRLVITQKTSPLPDPNLTDQFRAGFVGQGALKRFPQNALVTRYFWTGEILFRITNPAERCDWPSPPETTRAGAMDPRPPVRRLIKWAAQRTHRSRPIDLVPLLRCADCGRDGLEGDLAAGRLTCPGCGRRFVVTDGIPHLHPSGWTLR
jgi:SAM-dependent methyltransferase